MRTVLGPQVLFSLLQALSDPLRAVSVDSGRRETPDASVMPPYGPVADVELQSRLRRPVAVIDVRAPARGSEGWVKETPCFEGFPGYQHAGPVHPGELGFSVLRQEALRGSPAAVVDVVLEVAFPISPHGNYTRTEKLITAF